MEVENTSANPRKMMAQESPTDMEVENTSANPRKTMAQSRTGAEEALKRLKGFWRNDESILKVDKKSMQVCFLATGNKYKMHVESESLYLTVGNNLWRIDPLENDEDHLWCKPVRGKAEDIIWGRASDDDIKRHEALRLEGEKEDILVTPLGSKDFPTPSPSHQRQASAPSVRDSLIDEASPKPLNKKSPYPPPPVLEKHLEKSLAYLTTSIKKSSSAPNTVAPPSTEPKADLLQKSTSEDTDQKELKADLLQKSTSEDTDQKMKGAPLMRIKGAKKFNGELVRVIEVLGDMSRIRLEKSGKVFRIPQKLLVEVEKDDISLMELESQNDVVSNKVAEKPPPKLDETPAKKDTCSMEIESQDDGVSNKVAAKSPQKMDSIPTKDVVSKKVFNTPPRKVVKKVPATAERQESSNVVQSKEDSAQNTLHQGEKIGGKKDLPVGEAKDLEKLLADIRSKCKFFILKQQNYPEGIHLGRLDEVIPKPRRPVKKLSKLISEISDIEIYYPKHQPTIPYVRVHPSKISEQPVESGQSPMPLFPESVEVTEIRRQCKNYVLENEDPVKGTNIGLLGEQPFLEQRPFSGPLMKFLLKDKSFERVGLENIRLRTCATSDCNIPAVPQRNVEKIQKLNSFVHSASSPENLLRSFKEFIRTRELSKGSGIPLKILATYAMELGNNWKIHNSKFHKFLAREKTIVRFDAKILSKGECVCAPFFKRGCGCEDFVRVLSE